ncbi:MAG TPA: heme o synthase [Candidatus Solibacter sp.]|nr:heme o synthase [Candidatus Solibacter sp.]
MRDYLDLTKPRITLLILVCTAVGYWFGCGSSFRLVTLACTLLGTALLASGTSALNQWYEVDSDSKMYRTRLRPIPAGRMTRRHALAFGVLMAAAGFVELWCSANPLAADLGLFTLLSYLLIYTPLKRRSPICTTVGAIAGAMPPVIGYTAAGRSIDVEALALFGILFVWQFPHFDAIAWMYRDDYTRGGIRMLPVIDWTGESTARRVVLCSLLLIPISLLPRFVGMSGSFYMAAAIAAGLALLYFSIRLAQERTAARARAVLVATIVYLPIVLAVMVADRRVS